MTSANMKASIKYWHEHPRGLRFNVRIQCVAHSVLIIIGLFADVIAWISVGFLVLFGGYYLAYKAWCRCNEYQAKKRLEHQAEEKLQEQRGAELHEAIQRGIGTALSPANSLSAEAIMRELQAAGFADTYYDSILGKSDGPSDLEIEYLGSYFVRAHEIENNMDDYVDEGLRNAAIDMINGLAARAATMLRLEQKFSSNAKLQTAINKTVYPE